MAFGAPSGPLATVASVERAASPEPLAPPAPLEPAALFGMGNGWGVAPVEAQAHVKMASAATAN